MLYLHQYKLFWPWKLRETGCGDAEWIHIAQDRVQWQAVMAMIRNSDSLKSEEFLDQLSNDLRLNRNFCPTHLVIISTKFSQQKAMFS